MSTINGLTFSHDLAGRQVLELSARIGTAPAAGKKLTGVSRLSADIGITSACVTSFHVYRGFSASTGISAVFELALNVGTTDVITFGDLVLTNAAPMEWDEISLSCRSARIWDGSESLEVMPVTGYTGKFQFMTRDYNDITKLLSLVGKNRTLRVYGKPYRNCYIWGTIRKKQVKRGFSMWIVEFEVKQDSCANGVT